MICVVSIILIVCLGYGAGKGGRSGMMHLSWSALFPVSLCKDIIVLSEMQESEQKN